MPVTSRTLRTMNQTLARAARALLGGALAALALAAPAAAQTTTTGQIRGQVTDAQGAPVAEARVTATSVETGLVRTGQTSTAGTYTVLLLPPGDYNVQASRLGFSPSAATRVRVVVGSSATANFRLEAGAVALEGLSVTAERTPTATSTGGVAQTVTQAEVENLPVQGRDFTDFINLSGLVAPQQDQTTGGQFSIAGARPSQSSLQVDGVDANNSFFGENRGGSRIPFAFSLGSIREFQVVTNGFDVEYGNYSGGVVNVVTRGGTNDFEGYAYGNFRNERLTGDNFFPTVSGADTTFRPADYSVTQYAARVSGPVLKDRLFYLFSMDGQRRREPQNALNRGDYLLGANPDTAAYRLVGEFFDVLRDQYGVESPERFYQPYSTSNDVLTLFGRLDWNLNDNHRLSVRHNYSNYENANEGGTFFAGSSQSELLKGTTNSFVSELQSVLGGSTNNVLRFQLAWEDRPRNGNELRPGISVQLRPGLRVLYGGTRFSFNNNLEERKGQLIDNLTHVVGNHTLKAGFNGTYTTVTNSFLDLGANNGYQFASLADFAAYRPSRYTRNVRADGQMPVAEFDVAEAAFYAQDSWQATPKLGVTFGLRYDIQRFLDEPGRVIDAERAFGVKSGIAPNDDDNISPRLSLTYDLRGDGGTILRAGAGYLYGRVPYVLGGNVAQTEVPVLGLTCDGEQGDPDAPPSPSNYGELDPRGSQNPVNCAGASGVGGIPTYTFWSPGFEFPETFKSNLGFTHRLGERTGLSLDLLYSASQKLYTVRNLNLRDPVFTLENEGGRRVFTAATQFDPANASTGAYRNTEFREVYANYNDGFARSFAATAELTHRFSASTGVRASYTFARASDNSSYSCCTVNEGFTNPRVGIFGPNEIGGVGDENRAWGPSNWVREHTIVLAGNTRLPYGFEAGVFWRLYTGTPWGPEQDGDLNGDGAEFNDRLFIFKPEDLPLAATDPAQVAAQRKQYSDFLAEYDCVGDHVGEIIPRNSCRNPSFNSLDVRLSKSLPTIRGQRAQIQVDLFNVLNGLNKDWGRYEYVRAANRNLLNVNRYDPATGKILYSVNPRFGQFEAVGGADALLQFQAQIGVQYSF